MRIRITAFLLPTLLATTLNSEPLAAPVQNLLPHGTFELHAPSDPAGLFPTGWSFPDHNDKPWIAGFKAETVVGDSGGKEVRFLRPMPAGSTLISSRITMPKAVSRLRVRYRVLPLSIIAGDPDEAGNGAGLFARFYDDTGTVIRGHGGWAGPLSKTSGAEWETREHVFKVPATVATLEVQFLLRSASGEIRVDDIEIYPLSPL